MTQNGPVLASAGAQADAPWHARDAAAVAAALATDPIAGLATAEIAPRRAAHGPNELAEGPRRHPLRMLLAQFTDVTILLLLAAAIVAGVAGEPADAIAIAVIVVLNGTLGFVQEYRAERAMAALRALAGPQARVRRDGVIADVPAAELVPGDLVLLEAGSAVPADLRLVEAAGLRIDESTLTGESEPVEKTTGTLAPDLPAADRRNIAHKGTTVTHGRGLGLVVATGMQTELGRIASLLQHAPETATPLQRRLGRFGRRLAFAIVLLCAALFVHGLARGEPPLVMFLTALSLAVAAIPEALPAVVTVSLALGARRMVLRRALVRRLPAVEALGSVTVVCSDKTGTLTENRMRVGAVEADPGEPSELLLLALALSHDAEVAADGTLRGDPTETALLQAALDRGADPRALAARLPRIAELPFDAERARMTTVHADGATALAFVKGAPEAVLPRCTTHLRDTGARPLERDAVLAQASALARAGLRVLAVALRRLPGPPPVGSLASLEDDLAFLGFVGLLDPPRAAAADAVAVCHTAGIDVVMITGDHPETATAIARRLRIGEGDGAVLTGRDLMELPPEALAERVRNVRVYARVAPEQKIAIVEALQAHGELVAMTGDGVNDAPALRRADIGVAMGRGGTDVAREAADMVLLDDDFATIVAAIDEGRRIYDNLRKFIRYALAGNAGEIWTLALAPVIGLPIPLLPIHILWVNLVTDGLPGLALAAEPAERAVMRRPPRPPDESVFARGLGIHVIWVGILLGALTLGVQAWAWHTGRPHWQSMTFTVLTVGQMAHVMAIRSERESLFTLGLRSNLALLGAVAITLALQLVVLYLPAAQPIFHTGPLSAAELLLCVGLSSVVFIAVELEKLLARRGWLYHRPRPPAARRPDAT